MRRHIPPFDGIKPGSKYRHALPSIMWLDQAYRRMVSVVAPGLSWRYWRINNRAARAKQRAEFRRHSRAFIKAGLCFMPRFSEAYYLAVKDFANARFKAGY
jgi:hypothetical protein